MLVVVVVSVEAASAWRSLFLSFIIHFRPENWRKSLCVVTGGGGGSPHQEVVMKVRCLLVSQAFVGAFGRCHACLSVRMYQLGSHWMCLR